VKRFSTLPTKIHIEVVHSGILSDNQTLPKLTNLTSQFYIMLKLYLRPKFCTIAKSNNILW